MKNTFKYLVLGAVVFTLVEIDAQNFERDSTENTQVTSHHSMVTYIDADGDGVTNMEEIAIGSDPLDISSYADKKDSNTSEDSDGDNDENC
jgi:hypothetical protein